MNIFLKQYLRQIGPSDAKASQQYGDAQLAANQPHQKATITKQRSARFDAASLPACRAGHESSK